MITEHEMVVHMGKASVLVHYSFRPKDEHRSASAFVDWVEVNGTHVSSGYFSDLWMRQTLATLLEKHHG
jgi:hypothetical protein